MKKIRVYADTSVYGGCFDDEFARESLRFFEEVRSGRFVLILSEALLFELRSAPERVREILRSIPAYGLETVEMSDELDSLRDAYIHEEILPLSSVDDASHIAAASIAEVDLLISWNFKHIVHFDKIRGFNAVNLLMGYKPIQIFSPKEVIEL
jgi:hypothetical protein